MTGSVFISYRREDSSGYARAIYNELRDKLGPENIFMDVDAIEPGLDFVKAIEGAVGRCDILLAMIGPRWLAVGGESGPRLLTENDYVRTEIATALKRDIRVIPILVGGSKMPTTEDLPEDLTLLTRRNAIEIRHTHFDSDVTSLIKVLMKLVNPEQQKISTSSPVKESERTSDGITGGVAAKPKKQWLGPVITGLFLIGLGFVLFLFIGELRISTTKVRYVRAEDALLTSVGIVVLTFFITQIAAKICRRHWAKGLILGLLLFTTLGAGVGFWFNAVLRVKSDELSMISAVTVGAIGFLVFLGKSFVQRKQLGRLGSHPDSALTKS
jgi:hypothetical protein